MEDDATAALLFRRRLERDGYIVDIAGDGEAGLSLSAERDYDLIALDYNMPKLDGISVLRALAGKPNVPPVIMITAQNDTETAVEAMRLGAYDYLVKGANSAYLLLLPGVVERALQKRRLELEQQRTIAELHIQNRNLALLSKVAQVFTSSLDVEEITQALVKSISEFTDTRGSSVWLWDSEEESYLKCVAIFPHPESYDLNRLRLTPGQGIAGWVAKHSETANVVDASLDPRHSPIDQQSQPVEVQSLMAIPIRARDKTIGVLELVNNRRGAFSVNDQVLAETLASSAGVAVENARLVGNLRERSEELQARNEELDAFAHTVAHDLKNPLWGMVGTAELLDQESQAVTSAEAHQALRDIVRSGHKMSSIIEEILVLAGVNKAGEVRFEALEMEVILAEARARLSYLWEEYGAVLVEPESWPITYGHPAWIEEVWVNYLSNAVKYGGRPPQIEVGAILLDDGMVRCWVKDNGTGIAPEVQGRLFGAFTRLGTVRLEGSGLGLSIVKRIVERHGGQVGVESSGIPGEGSCFSFTLPGERMRRVPAPPQASQRA